MLRINEVGRRNDEIGQSTRASHGKQYDEDWYRDGDYFDDGYSYESSNSGDYMDDATLYRDSDETITDRATFMPHHQEEM